MERAGTKLAEVQTNMKKIIIIILLLSGIKGYSQTDTVIWYDDLKVYKIDTTVIWSDTSQAPNYLWANYHFISGNDSMYQSQFIMHDSLYNRLLPTTDLMDNGWRSSGTVKEFKLNATQIQWTPEQLRDSLILPDLKIIFGNNNVTKF